MSTETIGAPRHGDLDPGFRPGIGQKTGDTSLFRGVQQVREIGQRVAYGFGKGLGERRAGKGQRDGKGTKEHDASIS